jgi:hypothetical protein
MSKTLKLDTLKDFKPKGVNVDRTVIDSALKDFNDDRSIAEGITSPVENKPSNLDPKLQVKEVTSASMSSLEEIKVDYERKISLLEKKVRIAESQDKPLSKNEEKLLSAIRSERINQSVGEPIIGRGMLIRKYKMNSKYLDDSIKALEERKLIKRTKVPYSAKVMTYAWKLL